MREFNDGKKSNFGSTKRTKKNLFNPSVVSFGLHRIDTSSVIIWRRYLRSLCDVKIFLFLADVPTWLAGQLFVLARLGVWWSLSFQVFEAAKRTSHVNFWSRGVLNLSRLSKEKRERKIS